MLLQNSEAMVAIDMPAGPSEVLVIADAAANPTHIAIDLLSQVGGVQRQHSGVRLHAVRKHFCLRGLAGQGVMLVLGAKPLRRLPH